MIAPAVGGVTHDDGSILPAQQMVGGGPSVLYDAVAVVTGPEGAATLAALPAAKDFVADAHDHGKFIGHTPDAAPLFAAAGLDPSGDAGYHTLGSKATVHTFLEACRDLRFWDRT